MTFKKIAFEDVLLFFGVGLVGYGTRLEYGDGIASIVVGVILIVLGFLSNAGNKS